MSTTGRPGVRHSSEPRKRFFASGSSDEDPYSLTPSGSSGSSGKGNNNNRGMNVRGGNTSSGNDGSGSNGSGGRDPRPRLPLREKEYYGPQNWAKVCRRLRRLAAM